MSRVSPRVSTDLMKLSKNLIQNFLFQGDLEQKINALQGIGQNLDNQRQPLAEVGSLGDKLQTILTDPSSKSEIKGKVGQIERAFNNCRKKLDNALAELENADREGREFAAACAGMFFTFLNNIIMDKNVQ